MTVHKELTNCPFPAPHGYHFVESLFSKPQHIPNKKFLYFESDSLVFLLRPNSTMVVNEISQMVGYQLLSRHAQIHWVPILELLPQFAEKINESSVISLTKYTSDTKGKWKLEDIFDSCVNICKQLFSVSLLQD